MARLDYFAPGVYVEEVSRGSRPIQGISMSVAGFVGFTEDVRSDAELYKPTLITSWTQYLENFARIGSDGFTNFGAYLPFAVKGWFENGGGRCWVVSMGTGLPVSNGSSGNRSLGNGSSESRTEIVPDPDSPPDCLLLMTNSQRPSLRLCRRPDAPCSGRIIIVIQPDEPAEPEAGSDTEMFDTGEYFQIRLENNGEVLNVYRHLTMAEQPEMGTNIVAAVADSEYIRAESIADPALLPAAQRPANDIYELGAKSHQLRHLIRINFGRSRLPHRWIPIHCARR